MSGTTAIDFVELMSFGDYGSPCRYCSLLFSDRLQWWSNSCSLRWSSAARRHNDATPTHDANDRLARDRLLRLLPANSGQQQQHMKGCIIPQNINSISTLLHAAVATAASTVARQPRYA